MKNYLFCVFPFFALFIFQGPGFAATEKRPRAEVKTYEQLVSAIRKTRETSSARMDRAIDREKVREAWETGALIDSHVLENRERADYGEKVLLRLASDLETSHTDLKYMLRFARVYPIGPPAAQLPWSHYRELLSVDEEKVRLEITQKAQKEKWSRARLRGEVRQRQEAKRPDGKRVTNAENILQSVPGTPGTYRVVRAKAGPWAGQLALDLGFANYFQPGGVQGFAEGDIVVAAKERLKKIETGPDALFTYKAWVWQVIDGDTFDAVIELGFKITTMQKLRLRGLDSPEIFPHEISKSREPVPPSTHLDEMSEGLEAKVFLERQFNRTGGEILIKTVKSDKYDRYLTDVWVDGHYLNQELIEEGLAVRVSE